MKQEEERKGILAAESREKRMAAPKISRVWTECSNQVSPQANKHLLAIGAPTSQEH